MLVAAVIPTLPLIKRTLPTKCIIVHCIYISIQVTDLYISRITELVYSSNRTVLLTGVASKRQPIQLHRLTYAIVCLCGPVGHAYTSNGWRAKINTDEPPVAGEHTCSDAVFALKKIMRWQLSCPLATLLDRLLHGQNATLPMGIYDLD